MQLRQREKGVKGGREKGVGEKGETEEVAIWVG